MSESTLKKRNPRVNTLICRILFIQNPPPGELDAVEENKTNRLFSQSVALSGLRCLLTYVIFPILFPIFHALTNFAPYIGLFIGVFSLIFDLYGLRRFFKFNHRLRFLIGTIYLGIMILIVVLIAKDVSLIISQI